MSSSFCEGNASLLALDDELLGTDRPCLKAEVSAFDFNSNDLVEATLETKRTQTSSIPTQVSIANYY
jgi:hypothetical protein